MRVSKSLNPDQEQGIHSNCVQLWPHASFLYLSATADLCACLSECVFIMYNYERHVSERILLCAWRVGSCGRVYAESSGPAGSPAARRGRRQRLSSAEGKQGNKSAALATDWCVSPAADHTVTTAPTTGMKTETRVIISKIFMLNVMIVTTFLEYIRIIMKSVGDTSAATQL